MNRLPDLLLFIDASEDQQMIDDQDSLLTQRFINEILNEAKGMKTPQKIMKHMLDIIMKRKTIATQTIVSNEEMFLRTRNEALDLEVQDLRNQIEHFKLKDQNMQIKIVEQDMIMKELNKKLSQLEGEAQKIYLNMNVENQILKDQNENQIGWLRGKKEEIENNLEEKQSQITHFQAEVEVLTRQIQKLEQQIASQASTIQDLTGKIKEKMNEIKSLKQDLD
jgi:chromosome segregation ATPase